MKHRIRQHNGKYLVENIGHDEKRWRILQGYSTLPEAAKATFDLILMYDQWSGEDLSAAVEVAHQKVGEVIADLEKQIKAATPKAPQRPPNPQPGRTKKKGKPKPGVVSKAQYDV